MKKGLVWCFCVLLLMIAGCAAGSGSGGEGIDSSAPGGQQAYMDDPPYDPVGPSDGEESPSPGQAGNGVESSIDLLTMETNASDYPLGTEEIQVTVTNHSSQEGGTGVDYAVQLWEGEEWQSIPLDFDVEDLGVILMPGQDWTTWVKLHPGQHQYVAGRYRIVKHAYLDNDAFQLGAEFTLS